MKTMDNALLTNRLIQSVGTSVKNYKGEFLGKIMEVTRDATGECIEYIILKSRVLFGRGDRFFAIGASSTLIEINERGKIVLKLNKDDLQFAEGVSADECPKPKLKFGKTVYELYCYREPSKELENNSSLEMNT